ncbi:cation:proton antiporter [Caenispirillum salinarum]|uniref:cation:proton antiporter n=1 Tax=Caenispirillum salinarum TaxID=859058 RepID=UPI003851224F
MSIDTYAAAIAGIGFLILLVAWVPLVIRRMPLSLPMICMGLGVLLDLALSPGVTLDFRAHPALTERLTELLVLISLTSAGLRIDERLSLRQWRATFLLLGVTMPLSIVAGALIGGSMLGLSLATALLLGAVLAPTDPVLAGDVQVGPPRSGPGGHARFTLTTEAGLNDGLAFPFVWFAIGAATNGGLGGDWTLTWLVYDVGWRIAAGCAAGWAVGWLLGWLTFRRPRKFHLAASRRGFVSLGITFLSYGVAELIHGYGFLAVFLAALTVRRTEQRYEHTFAHDLHQFTDQIEHLMMMGLLIIFGFNLTGGLLAPLTWSDMLVCLVLVVVVRPACGLAGLALSGQGWREVLVTSFFGVRGVGSFFYLAFGINHAGFADEARTWAIVSCTVAISVVLHGLLSTPVMDWLDRAVRARRKQAAENEG